MLQNYIKTAIRNLLRYKGFSLISIVGLATGLASCILIILFVTNELSFDKYNKKAGQIYRAYLRYDMGSNQFDSPYCPVPLAQTLQQEYAEVLKTTRLYHLNYRNKYVYVKYEDKQFKEENFLWADSTVFDIFTIPLVVGNPKRALMNSNSIIVTPETAKKYFGNENAVGKMLTLQDGSLYEVTGIAKKLPPNSHFQFDFLASFAGNEKSRDPEWYDTAVCTYLLLQENYNEKDLNKKLPDISKKYVSPIIESAMGISYDKFIESGNYFGFFIESLLDIHLYSEVDNGLGKKGNINTVIIFSGIALLILIIASINFINLATARSSIRANEVGIRKLVGSTRSQLILQFLTESIVTCFLSLFIAIIFVFLLLPYMNNLLGTELHLYNVNGWLILFVLFLSLVIVGILAGSYPAFLLTSFRLIEVLTGKIQTGKKGKLFRNVLVVFQFSTSIVLIIGTIVIFNQLHYIQNKDLGFENDQIIIIQNVNKLSSNQKSFKEQLKKYTNIVNATYTDCLPQMMLEVKPFQKIGEGSGENHTIITITADYDFMDTYKFKMHDGRFFDHQFSMDTSSVLLNQAAIQALGFKNPLNEKLLLLGKKKRKMNVIGVIKNFHIQTIHEKIKPMASILMRDRPGEFLSARIQAGRISETIEFIENRWNMFVPEQPLEFTFFDDQFQQAYQSEIQSEKMFASFAFLAILIACLGLFGLASFTVSRRTKEIGIRKALGATEISVVKILSGKFLKWVLISNLIAWPVAWIAMNSWLQNFAYKSELSLWIFVLAGLLALIIAVLTISTQTIKAALSNPVESLRYE
jgi:putative ABC transport system permease protein